MPNRFTPALDAVASCTVTSPFDAIFGEYKPSKEQSSAWRFLMDNGMTSRANSEEKNLFWCFIAELSDQDLEECFPEIFPPSTKEL